MLPESECRNTRISVGRQKGHPTFQKLSLQEPDRTTKMTSRASPIDPIYAQNRGIQGPESRPAPSRNPASASSMWQPLLRLLLARERRRQTPSFGLGLRLWKLVQWLDVGLGFGETFLAAVHV